MEYGETAESPKGFVKGELLHTIFRKEEEQFSIIRIKVLETNETIEEKDIVIKGYIGELDQGEPYLFYGSMVSHKRFGEQYEVTEYKRYVPETKDGLIQYLSSDLFYGIGKRIAERIVAKLGENAIADVLSNPDLLDGIQGLNDEKKERFLHDLRTHQGFDHVMVHLSKYGIGLKLAQKIYKVYRDEAIKVLEKDPYQYVFDIEGFGFHRADEAARKNNLAMDHDSRLQAACLMVLQDSMQAGHVYLPNEEVLKQAAVLLRSAQFGISAEQIEEQLGVLHAQKKVVKQEDRVYHPMLYFAETGFCSHMQRLTEKDTETEIVQAELLKIIGKLEEAETISYGKEQFEAIEQALQSKVIILTGGPGTGKTTVIKGFIKAYAEIHELSLDPKDYKDKDESYPFVLTAPTGRAAKRMHESTNIPASTIHRLLGWDGNDSFERDEDNPLAGRLLIVDEFSMVDIWLANRLFKAIPDDMQVLLVGDEDQLPSVGPGQVLSDLLRSEAVPRVMLKDVYRQKEGSKIITIAHAIKNGTLSQEQLEKDKDFNFIPCREHQVVDVITQIVGRAVEKGWDMRDVQLLAPMYRSQAGIHELNKQLQQLVNPKDKQKREMAAKDVIFRKGDKVIQLVNDPEEGVFNGDIGEVVALFREEENVEQKEQLVVAFEEKEVVYESKDLSNLMHAYCISIHKSQGSEFPIVILPVVPGYRRMLRKNLLYTGITRAQRSLILVGEKQAFLQGIQTEDTNQRYTSLVEHLGGFHEAGDDIDRMLREAEAEQEDISPYDFM